MNPAVDVQHSRQSVVEILEPGIEKIIIGIADVTAQPAGPLQFIFDRRAVIGHHAAKSYRKTSSSQDDFEELQVIAYRLEGAGRIQQHEAVLKHQADTLQKIHRADILIDSN